MTAQHDTTVMHTRQAILDYVNDHPGITTAEIAKAFGRSRSCIQNYMRVMRLAGEVEAEDRIVNASVVPYYTALTITINAPLVMNDVTTVVGIRTVHRGTDRVRPLRNQRGQGAVRRPAGARLYEAAS